MVATVRLTSGQTVSEPITQLTNISDFLCVASQNLLCQTIIKKSHVGLTDSASELRVDWRHDLAGPAMSLQQFFEFLVGEQDIDCTLVLLTADDNKSEETALRNIVAAAKTKKWIPRVEKAFTAACDILKRVYCCSGREQLWSLGHFSFPYVWLCYQELKRTRIDKLRHFLDIIVDPISEGCERGTGCRDVRISFVDFLWNVIINKCGDDEMTALGAIVLLVHFRAWPCILKLVRISSWRQVASQILLEFWQVLYQPSDFDCSDLLVGAYISLELDNHLIPVWCLLRLSGRNTRNYFSGDDYYRRRQTNAEENYKPRMSKRINEALKHLCIAEDVTNRFKDFVTQLAYFGYNNQNFAIVMKQHQIVLSCEEILVAHHWQSKFDAYLIAKISKSYVHTLVSSSINSLDWGCSKDFACQEDATIVPAGFVLNADSLIEWNLQSSTSLR